MPDQPGPAGRNAKRSLLDRPRLQPEQRVKIGRLVVGLLGWGVVATAVLGLLALWHLVRRGRFLRASLAPPRPTSWPDPDVLPPDR